MILLMKVGDKAKVILPSHLAFGLTGDSKKVAQSMPLLYDLELVALD
jgi:FKBP-type peptidyl-prolyl cis-trans isomerase